MTLLSVVLAPLDGSPGRRAMVVFPPTGNPRVTWRAVTVLFGVLIVVWVVLR